MSMNTFVPFIVGVLTAGTPSDGVEPGPGLSVPPLAGTVVDEESGRPLEGVIVRLEAMGSIRAWTQTDAAGRYEFQDWWPLQTRTPAGELVVVEGFGVRVTVRALHPHYGMSAKELEVRCPAPPLEQPGWEPCTQYVGFGLRAIGPSTESSAPSCTLEGRVVIDGHPGTRAEALLERGEVEAVADSNGRFRVEGVAPGLRTMIVRRIAATRQERTIWVWCEGEGDVIRVGFELNEIAVSD